MGSLALPIIFYPQMIRTITSTQNAYIKQLKSLKSKKGRSETGLFIAEGDKCASEAIENGCAQALLTRDDTHPLVNAAEAAGVDVYVVSEAVLAAVSDSKTPQTALAVCPSSLLPVGSCNGRLVVALEDVADPQNVGTIIRTADAAGACAVMLSAGCADFTSPKAVRAAMGSIFHVPVKIVNDFPAALNSLKDEGVTLVAGHLKGKNALPDTERCCILIGNEARGLSDEISALADVLYKINIYGRAESLNAAVAAGILMYKIADR